MTGQGWTPARGGALALGAIELALGLLFIAVMLQSSDPLGAAIGRGMAMLTAVPLMLFVVPGLVLAVLDRALPLALGLEIGALPVAFLLWRVA